MAVAGSPRDNLRHTLKILTSHVSTKDMDIGFYERMDRETFYISVAFTDRRVTPMHRIILTRAEVEADEIGNLHERVQEFARAAETQMQTVIALLGPDPDPPPNWKPLLEAARLTKSIDMAKLMMAMVDGCDEKT